MDGLVGVSVRDLRSDTSEYLDDVMHRGRRLLITRNNKPTAVMISVADYEDYQRLQAEQSEHEAAEPE